MIVAEEREQLLTLKAAIRAERARRDPDPVRYAHDVLKIPFLWSKMAEIARALMQPPRRVMVLSGHGTGKTFLAAMITNFFYDTYNPSLGITTAPTSRDVKDLLWKEIRLQRSRAGLPNHFIGSSSPHMQSSWDHYAKGYTASKGESFQGRHDDKMLFVFDEACGVNSSYWTTTKTMWKPELGHAWLAILNPTDTTSQAYLEEQDGGWAVFNLSCLEHPNIVAELKGERPPVPAAVSLAQVNGWVNDWCEPITMAEATATDVEWPPQSGKWFRPGPEFESRCLGRWPSLGTYGVWSDGLWQAATTLNGEPRVHACPLHDLPQIGCDVARFGDDLTAIHARWGDTSLSHESANGWATTQTVGRIIEIARELSAHVNAERTKRNSGAMTTPQELPIKVDDDGIGGAVTDRLSEQGYNVQAVRSGTAAMDSGRYPNKRSELWFATAARARAGCLALGWLDKDTLRKLKSQAMAPEWKQDSAGRRVVEPKDKTKEKIGRSPDDMDALNLAYYEGVLWDAPPSMPPMPTPAFGTDAWMAEHEGGGASAFEERRPRRKIFARR